MVKKILLYSNNRPESLEIKEGLEGSLIHPSIQLVGEDEVPDYIISIGGDGTFLSAFHRFKNYLDHAKFIGIHTGHLGFYTDWLSSEVDLVCGGIINETDTSVSYPLLEVDYILEDGTVGSEIALNEFSIRSSAGTMVGDVYIKGYFFETFRGDGICVSTPTGSTGLNKSLGGAVIHPRLDALQMTEMASINNRVYRTLGSSIIIPHDEWFVIKPEINAASIITIDNLHWDNQKVKEIKLYVSDKRIKFANFRHTHFWDRVENAFIGRQQDIDIEKELRRG